mmetsp:Transcript_21645/g.35709  ORF Transcript_21645/g.35709 Transcript_21645/m.35709 type:complete len:233 (+) Transcript_21645:17-715(+)|eukprot:CAMPEP_0119310100 /NCGR_PEP_ID=MMETSP1333-20130426/17702_1 /TAXON_ID=418940 /ORGANISM="Scyphosphaera apsteinii, Strain RCC1455" /LENGTH=232 /DNA_ID=CAMNT_0007314217 /DNA_START=19 /DNA_END=717 /DNA_ORIENTATION=+
MSTSSIALLATSTASLVAPIVTPVVRDGAALRSELISHLHPGTRTALVPGSLLFSLVEQLEQLGSLPSSSAMLYFALDGHWEQRAWSTPFDAGFDAQTVAQLASTSAEVLSVTQSFVGTDVSTTAEFTVVEEALHGALSVSSRLGMTSRPDTCNFFTGAQALSFSCMPKDVQLSALLDALHSQLGAEMRAAENVRLGMQTTYIDDDIRITRCLTRSLAGACTVYVRCKGKSK